MKIIDVNTMTPNEVAEFIDHIEKQLEHIESDSQNNNKKIAELRKALNSLSVKFASFQETTELKMKRLEKTTTSAGEKAAYAVEMVGDLSNKVSKLEFNLIQDFERFKRAAYATPSSDKEFIAEYLKDFDNEF